MAEEGAPAGPTETALVEYEKRTYDEEMKYLVRPTAKEPCCWTIKRGFVPNMKASFPSKKVQKKAEKIGKKLGKNQEKTLIVL